MNTRGPGYLLQHCQFVCDHLQGNHSAERGERTVRGDYNRIVVQSLRQPLLVRDYDKLGASRLDLLACRAHVVGVGIVQHEHDDWSGPLLAIVVVLNQGERAVLERPAAVALGVEVTNFF